MDDRNYFFLIPVRNNADGMVDRTGGEEEERASGDES